MSSAAFLNLFQPIAHKDNLPIPETHQNNEKQRKIDGKSVSFWARSTYGQSTSTLELRTQPPKPPPEKREEKQTNNPQTDKKKKRFPHPTKSQELKLLGSSMSILKAPYYRIDINSASKTSPP